MLEGIREDAVCIGNLPGGKPSRKVARQECVIPTPQVRLHLQRLHGFHASNVFSHECLIARAQQELLVQVRPEQRRDERTQKCHEHQANNCNQRQRPAVPDHQREENYQEWEIEKQGYGGAGQELPDRFNRLQSGNQRTCRAMLEIGHRQAQEVPEDVAAQDCVDSISRVQDKVLSQPGHAGRENHEDRQSNRYQRQRARGLVNDDLVDDHLREEGRCDTHHLQC